MGARNRGGIGLSYRPARLQRLAEFIPWNRFLGSLKIRALNASQMSTYSISVCVWEKLQVLPREHSAVVGATVIVSLLLVLFRSGAR